MNRLKGMIYDFICHLATLSFRGTATTKRLLIVRVDEIGDYVLWRAFLAELSHAERFAGYEIHFCGNSSYKSLFDLFDSGSVQYSHWLQKMRFKKEMRYRYSFLRAIYLNQYEVVINPVFSRDKRNDDAIVKAAKAKHVIGMVGNPESVRSYELGYDKGLYTELFDYAEKPIFEFIRNRYFTEFVTGKTSAITGTGFPLSLLPAVQIDLPAKYAVVFPGSRSKARIWPTGHFITVCNFLFTQYGFTIAVAGAGDDLVYTNAFCAAYTHPCINLYGKTSLPEMLGVLKNAACLLSVDTGSVHLAAAMGCTVFGVFNGSQYKRFAPYPANIAANFYAIYPDAVEQELKDAALVKQKYEFVVPVPYADVIPEKMIHSIYEHFKGG